MTVTTKQRNSRQQAHRRFNQEGEMIAVDELSEPAAIFQRRKEKSSVMLHDLSQNSEDGTGHRDENYRVNQRAQPAASVGKSDGQYAGQDQSRESQREYPAFEGIGANRILNLCSGDADL